MFIKDLISGSNFLVDTGASRSVWPFQSSKQSYGPILEGADGARIPAWGARGLRVRFGGQEFSFSFSASSEQLCRCPSWGTIFSAIFGSWWTQLGVVCGRPVWNR
jgi:hypothetical protein